MAQLSSNRWVMLAVGAATGVLIAAMIILGFTLFVDSETASATAADEDDNVVRRKLKVGRQPPTSAKDDDERPAFVPKVAATPAEPGIFDYRGSTNPGTRPGKLSLNCRPACDSIVTGGRSLGPSPMFTHRMPPGVHRVTLKGNGKTKTIMVEIASGMLTTQTVPMK